jgi:hypothetical protein
MDGYEADGPVSYTNQDLQEAPDRPSHQDRVRIKRDLECVALHCAALRCIAQAMPPPAADHSFSL